MPLSIVLPYRNAFFPSGIRRPGSGKRNSQEDAYSCLHNTASENRKGKSKTGSGRKTNTSLTCLAGTQHNLT